MNTNSNTYTIVYASVMVVIVAFLLAFVSSALKPQQDANVAIDKKKQILYSLNVEDKDMENVEEKYKELIVADPIYGTDAAAPTAKGEQQDQDGFQVATKDLKDDNRPLYVCNVNGEKAYVIPVKGAGLWGGIWGYVSVAADGETVIGAYFNHEGETAGLGAEIKDNPKFRNQFAGKKLFNGDNKQTVALSVLKQGKTVDGVDNTTNRIDAVTGATLTSNGVNDMIHKGIGAYLDILDNLKK